jgi:Uma2 family endonuclease
MANSSTLSRPFPEGSPPLLEPGDHLTREEFERRYQAMPHLKKAELIEGVVFMSSAVRWNPHAVPQAALTTWLGVYWAFTPGVQSGDNGTLRFDLGNVPQPDAALIILPTFGGQARLSADEYIEGAPELVAEIAGSSASIDLNTKLRVYRRNRVREYIVWRVLDHAIDWFVLREGQYEILKPDTNDCLRSGVFPGLWLDPSALVRFDLATVLQVLQQGLASPEHAAFLAKLQQAASLKDEG